MTYGKDVIQDEDGEEARHDIETGVRLQSCGDAEQGHDSY